MNRDVYAKIIAKIKDLGEKINNLNDDTKVGDLDELTTTAKTDVVSAINEVDGEVSNLDTTVQTIDASVTQLQTDVTGIGTLTDLTTTAKNNLVSSVNEVNAKVTGMFMEKFTRGAAGYNDITINNIPTGGVGCIITSAGLFAFYCHNGDILTTNEGLSITHTDSVYRFTCGGQWNKDVLFICSWNWRLSA